MDAPADVIDNVSVADGLSAKVITGSSVDLVGCFRCLGAAAQGHFGAREDDSDSAPVRRTSLIGRRSGSSGTRLGRIRPFGADAASVVDGSTSLAPNAEAATRCASRSNPVCGDLDSGIWALGVAWPATLGRRRTSTVNVGTLRLNVVLDTACRPADSSLGDDHARQKRSKAIGDYLGGDKPSRSPARIALVFGQIRLRRRVAPARRQRRCALIVGMQAS